MSAWLWAGPLGSYWLSPVLDNVGLAGGQVAVGYAPGLERAVGLVPCGVVAEQAMARSVCEQRLTLVGFVAGVAVANCLIVMPGTVIVQDRAKDLECSCLLTLLPNG